MKKVSVRVLSLLLVLCMVIGFVPVGALAAEDDTHYLMFATDRHSNTSIIGNLLTKMEADVGDGNIEYVGLGGDMVDGTSSYNSSTVLAEVTAVAANLNASTVDLVYASSHDVNCTDGAGIMNKTSGLMYTGEDYYVYGVTQDDMQNATSAASAAAAFTTWVSGLASTDNRVIIVLSHVPIHAQRGDNYGASYWNAALNAAAVDSAGSIVRDVVFFHGHNHTTDSNEYYYAVGSTISVQTTGTSTMALSDEGVTYDYYAEVYDPELENGVSAASAGGIETYAGPGSSSTATGTNAVINYTYITAGYLNANSDATLMAIDDSTITFTKYSTSGSSVLGTVTRVVTETETEPEETTAPTTEPDAELGAVTVSGTDAYALGDELSIRVYGTYTDGTVTEITEGYTISGDYDMNAVKDEGEYYQITVTYGGKDASFMFTVSEPSVFEASGVSVSGVFTIADVTVTENTDATASAAAALGVDSYVSYDIVPTGITNDQGETITLRAGNYATVSIPVDASWENVKCWYIPEEGEPEEIEGTLTDGIFTFRTSHFSTYLVGGTSSSSDGTEITVDEPTVGTVTGATTTETKTVYVLVSTPTAGNQYIIVSGNTAGPAYALKENTTTGTSVTINAATDSITAPYIETADTTIVWEVSAGLYFKSVSGGYYLNRDKSSLQFSTKTINRTSWTAGTNMLYSSGNSTYYLRYNNGWSAQKNSQQNVYFYEKQTVTVTTSANGTYSIAGNPSEISKVVVKGTTTTLGSTLTFVPESGSTTTTNTSSTATYTVVDGGDPNGIISGISGNTVTFTGKYGKALVKVSYTVTVNGTDYTVDNYITVTAKEPTYTVEITKDDKIVTEVVSVKGVTDTTTLQLGQIVTYETADKTETITPAAGTIEWEIPEEQQNIATIDQNGLVTFKGVTGTVNVNVSYKVDEGKYATDTITISANTSTYVTPDDSTSDFPLWGEPGSVRFDKTATAVGNFSNTGIAQVELSMAGLPTGGSKPFDVVVMLDTSGSMTSNNVTRLEDAKDAAQAFLNTICLKADGTWNGLQHGISICYFNASAGTQYPADSTSGMTDITSYADYQAAFDAIDKVSTASGTNYWAGLEHAYNILKNNYDPNRQQFLIFLSDGAPTSYAYISNTKLITSNKHTLTTTADGYTDSNGNKTNVQFVDANGTGQGYEIASSGVTAVPEYYSTLMKDAGVTIYSVGMAISDTDCKTLISHISSAASSETTTADNSHCFFTSDGEAEKLTAAFTQMGTEMMSAATNVEVEDAITDEYQLIFQLPAGITSEDTGYDEFYIEVVNYTLDATTHERTGAYEVLQRIYYNGTAITKILTGSVTAAGDETGLTQQTIAPVYKEAAEGENAYFDASGNYYPEGNGTHHMDSGAFLSTNSDGEKLLHTIYFTYNFDTQVFNWTVTSLSKEAEIELRYFVYLVNSGGVGVDNQLDAGTYPTNKYATLTYTNYLEHDCQQTFPVPQMTWNGAQVSYVFYLVNSEGKPVNRAGQEVTFAEAVFVTDIFTEAVTWNEDGGVTELNATKKAEELLPSAYSLFDSTTEYQIHVYQTEDGVDKNNYFVITAGGGTTMVYNTKAGTKYSTPGTYTKNNVYDGFDFANTTVAFAVKWQQNLVSDSVVVDFGLPVDIDVVSNDFVYNYVTGVGPNAPGYKVNTGYSLDRTLPYTETTVGGHKVEILNENTVRFTPGSGKSMEFSEPVTFYYEATVEIYEESNKKEGYMYSSVTVIPATTIYYEDSFLTLNASGTEWTQEGTTINATQDQDRPGEIQISDSLDANNVYGYDSAYKEMSTFSLGSAAKVTVGTDSYATASFSFYGTGFDVIGLTSNTTGTLMVDIMQNGRIQKTLFVDTYYGYTQNAEGEWVVSANDPNALYQVPVIKAEGLTYGQYDVVITATYNSFFDHTSADGYELYLDAVRIYDPTGNRNDTANDAYVADNEGWPQYTELRNNIIFASNYHVTENADGTVTVNGDNLSGAIFIDSNDANTSIADYVSYGPNNELYLANNQAIAFNVTVTDNTADVQLGIKVGNGNTVTYEINGDTYTVNSATDLYYSILSYANAGPVTIKNVSGGILSLTNIKVTYKSDPAAIPSTTSLLWMDEESVGFALMSLRNVESDVEEPDVTEPEATEPEATEPEATEPEATEPEATEPEATEPEATEPEVTEPEATEPEVTEPEATEPEVTEPDVEENGTSGNFLQNIITVVKTFFGWLMSLLRG